MNVHVGAYSHFRGSFPRNSWQSRRIGPHRTDHIFSEARNEVLYPTYSEDHSYTIGNMLARNMTTPGTSHILFWNSVYCWHVSEQAIPTVLHSALQSGHRE